MKFQTMRDQIRSVAERWRRQYPASRKLRPQIYKIQSNLDSLDVESASPEDVAGIIGNELWVEIPKCHDCGIKTWSAVELGEEPDYESNTATICIDCLRKAIEIIEKNS